MGRNNNSYYSNDAYGDLTAEERDIASSILDTHSGKLFGGLVKLPKEISVPAAPLIARATTWISKEGGKYVGKATEAILPAFGIEKTRAEHLGRITQKGFGYLFPFWEDVVSVSKTAQSYFAAKTKLKKEFAPLLAITHKGKSGLSAFWGAGNSNEMMRYAQSYIAKEKMKALGANATALIERAPQIMATHLSHREEELRAGLQKDHTGLYDSDFDNGDLLRKMEGLGVNSGHPDYSRIQQYQKTVKTMDNVSNFGVTGAALGRAILEEGFIKRAKKADAPDTPAWELLSQLCTEIDEQLPTDGKPMDSHREQRLAGDVARKVEEIFQQHQRNMKRKPVGERLSDEFQAACTKIAERIATGELDPMAIALLASNGKVIAKNGKSIVDVDLLEEELDRLGELFAQRDPVDVKKIIDEAPFDKPQLVQAFKELNVKGREHERVALAALFEDALLQEVGVSKEDITKMRKEMRQGVLEEIARAATHVAEVDPEELKEKYKLSNKEIETLQDFAQQVARYDSAELERNLKGKAGTAVKTTLRNLALATEDGKKLWAEAIQSEQSGAREPAGAEEGKRGHSKKKHADKLNSRHHRDEKHEKPLLDNYMQDNDEGPATWQR